MSKNSEAVKKWRKATKDRIIESMGGCCQICGYDKCTRSLGLHHLDPNEKELSFGSIRSSSKAWPKIVTELKKCILVCNNCHGEIHEGITNIPDEYEKFNEDYESYKIPKQIKTNSCPICGKEKYEHLITCSKECAGKRSYKVNWDEIDLKEELKNSNFTKLAEKLGCSNVAVRKRAKKLGLI